MKSKPVSSYPGELDQLALKRKRQIYVNSSHVTGSRDLSLSFVPDAEDIVVVITSRDGGGN